MLTPEVFAARRARFQQAIGEGVAIVPGSRLALRSNDTEFPFRQSSDLLYLTAFPQPEALAVLRRDRFVLFVQPRDPEAETWTGRRPGVEGATSRYGADAAHPIDALERELPALLEGAPRLYHRLGQDPATDARVLRVLAGLRARERRGVTGPEEIVDLGGVLHEMRLRKEPEELAVLRAAADISREAHERAARAIRPGRYEYEIEAELGYVFRRRGGSGPAYGSIVAGGDNATILHYVDNDARLESGELLLIDAGVELCGYASDITRTYPIDGRFEGVRREVYACVLDAQQAALDAIHPGTTLRAIHETATRRLVEGMVALGALAGEVDGLIESGAHTPFYMHGTSHFMGMDVHDVGNTHSGGKPRPLEPGMVFTVEPGLYFGAEREGTPERLRGIGVRIEDDVVITDDGYEVLTREIPKAIGDVEAWMRA